tara:strand:+ start:640 stop:1137 length:498 start_codon:yes stop_codon:yes gene_type:complete
MKNTILFKTLVDILYILHFIGLVGIIFVIPFGIVNNNQVNINVEDWSLFYWLISIMSLITYIIFLRGLYYLRTMARFLLTNKYFSEKIIENLKKSGNHFLFTGIISFSLFFILWLNKLYGGKFELIYDSNLLIPLFLTIIGMFFIIQSNTLVLAKNFKEENELTV